ncbi:uncharacterized protein LOC135522533 isoform X2 [Oncorhynchus masou masou]|uniref:uncharacterized protein LOC135522533 isoform X2 n=1 Tax=Oncorhynchus masou masou TaxID=90313 RepID=UPI003183BEEF
MKDPIVMFMGHIGVPTEKFVKGEVIQPDQTCAIPGRKITDSLEWEPVCPVRGLATGESTTVWLNVAHPALLNRHQNLPWMVAHEILPVRAVMPSWGMPRTPECP